jgi:hypothetical protein
MLFLPVLAATRVQSLANPCTVAVFYGGSVLGGTFGGYAAGGEISTVVNEAAAPYLPWILYFGRSGPAWRSNAVLTFTGKTYDAAANLVQRGCNALQE